MSSALSLETMWASRLSIPADIVGKLRERIERELRPKSWEP